MAERTVRVGTELAAEPADVLAALRRVDTFRYVVGAAMGFEGADGPLPDTWPTDGSPVALRIRPLHLPGGWRHTIRVVELDPAAGRLATEEGGGPVSRWRHVITVDPLRSGGCYYVDEVTIEAGGFTPLVAAFAAVFYRWRQLRWRRLARRLPL
ncbi:MAG TPA: hypothetical protein VK908_17570 [Jiangellales bacterium]|nr:hypothetical protein [Jiangellales bacterium]